MAETSVARFRRVFTKQLSAGRYGGVDLDQAVDAIATKAQLLECLDHYCTRVDPGKKYEPLERAVLCRMTPYKLFNRALELADPRNGLLELVQALPGGRLPVADAQLAKRLPVYRRYYVEMMDATDKETLHKRAQLLAKQRAEAAARARFLLDDLEAEYRRKNARAAQFGELLRFDFGSHPSRQRFECLAAGCEAALYPKKMQSARVVRERVRDAFAKFGQFVAHEVKEPLDLFRLLAWAKEPSFLFNTYSVVRGQAQFREVTNAWSAVWPELYEDIAAHGIRLAQNTWHIYQLQRAGGYDGKDLQFVLAPLGVHRRELFKLRMALATKPQAFKDAQAGRRTAEAWGRLKGLELVDELTVKAEMEVMAKEVLANLQEALGRTLQLSSDRLVFRQAYHMGQSAPGVFTVIWIPRQQGTQRAYVEMHAFPGYVFLAQGNRVGLVEQLEEKAFSELAANAEALKQFLLFCFEVLGYAFDLATAGASGGVRVVVFRFLEEVVKDKVASKVLDAAGIDNPWIQTLAGFAAGAVPSAVKAPKIGAVRTPEEIALGVEAGTLSKVKRRGGPSDKPRGGAADAPTTQPAKQAGAEPPPDIGGNVFVVEPTGNVMTVEELYGAHSGPGVLDVARRAVGEVLDRLTARPARGSVRITHAAGAGPDLGAAPTMLMRTQETARGALTAADRGLGGRPARGLMSEATKKKVARLRKSPDYKLLQRYERKSMSTEQREATAKFRESLADLVEGEGEVAAAAKIRSKLNDARRDSGELNAAADLYSSFDVADFVAVPRRENNVDILDVAVRLKPGSRRNAGKKFAFAEGKGGLRTALGEVTAKRYYFDESGDLLHVTPPHRDAVKQASGEWYYQKFAEIYALGQEMGEQAGKKYRTMAKEMLEAARKGEIASAIVKSNLLLDRKFIDNTAQVVNWFKARDLRSFPPFP